MASLLALDTPGWAGKELAGTCTGEEGLASWPPAHPYPLWLQVRLPYQDHPL